MKPASRKQRLLSSLNRAGLIDAFDQNCNNSVHPVLDHLLAKGQIISRQRFMKVLDFNLGEAGVQLTVRRYNRILTDLGFRPVANVKQTGGKRL